jgi:hypothetical protein
LNRIKIEIGFLELQQQAIGICGNAYICRSFCEFCVRDKIITGLNFSSEVESQYFSFNEKTVIKPVASSTDGFDDSVRVKLN